MANQFDPFAPTPNDPPERPTSNLVSALSDGSIWKNAGSSLSRLSVNQSLTQSNRSSSVETLEPKRVVEYDGPIATLSNQWDPYLAGLSSAQRETPVYLIIGTNESCIPTGVESVLNYIKNGSELNVSNLSLNGNDGTSSTHANSSATAKKSFFKSLKKAQGAIERGVTTMAIRADGGKNRDWVCVSLVYSTESNTAECNTAIRMSSSALQPSNNEICLSRTEWIQLPPADLRSEGLSFHIPLCIPDLSFCPTGSEGPRLTLRMYLRSGAALLNIVKKEYAVGECVVQYCNVLGLARQPQQPENGYSNTVNLPMTLGMLAECIPPAALRVTATPRMKCIPACRMGWSLTDAIFNKESLAMFQLPLDQAYVYPIVNTHQLLNVHRLTTSVSNNPSSSGILIANERAVESTLVLPIATAVSKLMADAAGYSAKLAETAAKRAFRRESLRCYAIPDEDEARGNAIADAALKDGCADVEIGVVALMLENGGVGPPVSGALSFQRCDSIFEETLTGAFSLPLMDKAGGEALLKDAAAWREAVVKRFCPRIYSGNLELDSGDTLLPGVLGTSSYGYVGSVRLMVNGSLGLSTADAAFGQTGGVQSIEGVVPLEPYLNPATQRPNKVPVLAPAIDANTGKVVGKFLLSLRVKTDLQTEKLKEALPDARIGLISTVGLNTLTEDLGMLYQLDNETASSAANTRQRQVATMGAFLTSSYLNYHAEQRAKDASVLSDRFEKYYNSVMSGVSSDVRLDDESDLPLFKRRTPRPFRPSNSRGNALLAGIGFNVHVQAMTLNILQDGQQCVPAAVATSITHGAPADHARGFGTFGNEDGESNTEVARGGLRRLEASRLEYAREVDENINGLISAVGEYFNMRAHTAAARQQAGMKNSRHIPTTIQACNFYRNRLIESMQKMHSLTWEISVRRANCFSQALGIAVTSYLASISYGGSAWRFASVWAQHGYLITFEGLLSAVGKELGMIEDASTAVEMLRMTSVVLVSTDSATANCTPHQIIPVAYSPYVRSVSLQTHSEVSGINMQYRLEIALDPSYFQTYVPAPLRGTSIRFVPVLFQMGVDIRQWGANAGRNVTTQIKDRTKAPPGVDDCCADVEVNDEPICGLIDDGDDDDEGGRADTEILVTLNREGFAKLNVYAHSINPTSITPPAVSTLSLEQMQSLPAHPLLSVLSDTVRTSAGKMEHGVLDQAATACQRLGGGSTVFCKSGKDRTAMQVTFKQAQFLQRFLGRKDANVSFEDAELPSDEVFTNATLMRVHGTRVPICEKNAGESKYAFNPLQAKFMPDALKPPPIALAGFLKKPET